MKKSNVLLVSFLLLLVFIKLPTNVAGQSSPTNPHYTKSNLVYDITENSAVHANLNFTLSAPSQPGHYWTYEKSFPIGSSNVTNIQVQGTPSGRVDHNIEQNSDTTTIHIKFEIYSGEDVDYSISYKAKDLVSKEMPKYSLQSSLGSIEIKPDGITYDNYKVRVNGPPETELFTYNPKGAEVVGENVYFAESLGFSESFGGISGTWFKSPAYYEVTLTEELKNETSEEIKDLSYDLLLFNREDNWQYSTLYSTPSSLESIYVGKENNWRGVLGVDSLESGGSKEFQFKILHQIKVHDPDISKSNTGSLSKISSNFEPYLQSEEYWPVENPDIQNVASQVVGEEKNSYLVAKKITEFVVNRLDYENQTGRLGALDALINEVGDCSEYTDLSITLARASGLPARASYGWGYKKGTLIGHAWPEFYLPNVGWQPADPTWIDTGGKISSGGIRPGSGVPPGLKGKSSPALSGSFASYLYRLDTIHIQRNLRWIGSSESYGEYHYKGGEPDILEDINVEVISKAQAAEDFLEAAELNEKKASNLLGSNKKNNLAQEIDLAENYLTKAKNASDYGQIIEFSKKSINHSSEVIISEGEPPKTKEEGFNLSNIPVKLVILTALIISIIVGIGYGINRL